VVLKRGTHSARRVAARQGRRHHLTVGRIFGSALKGYSAKIPPARLAALKADRRVAYVVPDEAVGAAGRSSGSTQTTPTGVNRAEGDLSGTLSGNGSGAVTGVGVAVIDSGSGPHPDLNVAGGTACVGQTYDDGNGHGTHVAGTIAAKDDATGVVGIAPGAPIYSVRVLDASNTGTTAEVLCGIDWVTANAASLGIKVANMSLVTPGSDDGNCGAVDADPVHQAVCALVAKGVIVVAAAGNDALDFSATAPASYHEVLAVTAVSDTNGIPGGGGVMPNTCAPDDDDSAANFSNFASPLDAGHTIAAPGKCLNSTWRGGGYKLDSGTSMASPHVAGAAALCIFVGICANLSPAQIVDRLRADAAAQPASYGFSDDPYAAPNSGRYYGYMLYTGGYKNTKRR
jgi:subtilisin family serine protease